MAEFTYKWLVWDGSYTLRGRCNQAGPDDAVAGSEQPLLLPVLHLPPGQVVKRPSLSIVAATAVSVRLINIVESADNALAIKVQLKRLKKVDGSWNIKSLMLRIYQNYDPATDKGSMAKEKLVYQEVLRKEQIDQLAEANKENDSGLVQAGQGWLSGAQNELPLTRNQPGPSPYKIRLWVSTRKNAFGREDDSLLPFTGEPETSYTVQVHDQYRPTEAEFQEKFDLADKDTAWEDYINKREAKEKAGKYEDKPGKNLTTLPYFTLMAPAAEVSLVQETLQEAARLGVPFTEGLIELAKASTD